MIFSNFKKLYFLAILFSVVFFCYFSTCCASALEQLQSDEPFKISNTNQLSIILYPAGTMIDWDTPGELVRSVVWNTIKKQKHPLAHMDIFLRCEGQKPLLTGMSRKKTWKTYSDILFKRASLELLTSRFPGFLLNEQVIIQYLQPAISEGRVRAVSFDINNENCLRLKKYYTEYVDRGYDDQYSGFTSNPFLGEGAGCSAFALSFVYVAGLLEPYLQKSWSRNISVPLRLIEKSSNLPTFWSYMLGVDEKWASASENSQTLIIYDPEKIYHWVYAQTNERHISQVPSKLVFVGKAIELVIDAKNINRNDNYWNYSWPPHQAQKF